MTICGKMAVYVLLSALTTITAVHASESWTCSRLAVDGKPYKVIYTVSGTYLITGEGVGRSKILVNDDHLLIAFNSFLSTVHRKPPNMGEIELQEPFTFYIILDKRDGRMLVLDNQLTQTMSDTYGSLPDAHLDDAASCHRN